MKKPAIPPFLACLAVLASLCWPHSARAQTFATLPFSETFESGVLQSCWTVSGTGPYRGRITTANSPHTGLYHYTMDCSLSSGTSYARNELTLGINLAGYTNVVLTFWVKSFGNRADGPPPTPFTGGADFDGVAISQDGVLWYEVQGLRNLTSSYVQYTVNLDSAVAAFALSYNSTFRIRFNQYGNLPIANSDGIGFDDISVTGNLVGVLHHFNFSSVPAPQLVNTPFPVTITAVDAANGLVPGFTGTVNLWGVLGTSTVPVSPALTANFVNGSWTGSITVTQAAPTLRLHADDGLAHTGDGNSFSVLATNDLALTASGPGAPVPLGTNLVYQLNVLNPGPAPATGVVVTNVLPASTSFVSFSPGQGTFSVYGQNVAWTLGTVAAQTNISASLVVTPATAGFFTNSATVWRSGADADPANNTAILTNQVAAMGILAVSPPAGFNSAGIAGGPFTPSSQTYVLSNSGSATFTFNVIRSAAWVTRSLTSGSLGPGDSATVKLTLNSTTLTLGPGNYFETIFFTNVSTSLGSTTRLINLSVATNHLPVATGLALSTLENIPLTVTLPGADADNDPLTANITFLPLYGRLFQTPDGATLGAPITTLPAVVSNSLRQVIYVPPTNFFGNGLGNFYYNLSDGRTNSTAASVSIDIIASNQPPVAVPDTVYVLPGVVSNPFDVLANDFDAEGDYVTFSHTSPSLGTLTPLGGTQFIYTPKPGVVRGTDSFTYTIIDSFGRPVSAKVTINIGYLTAGNWPTMGNDPQHTGYYPSSLGTNLFVPLWTNIYTGTINQVAAADGMVFLTMSSGVPYILMMAALDAQSGRQLWRDDFTPGNSITAPTFDNGRLYFQRNNNNSDTQLRCVDAATGAILWTTPYGGQWDWSFAPLVVGDGVWICGGYYGGMYGFDTATGGTRFFDNYNDGFDTWTPSWYEDVVYSWENGVFRASDPVYGSVLWSLYPPGNPSVFGTMSTAAAIRNDRAVLMANTYLDCIDLVNQSIPWAIGGSFGGSPSIVGNTVYCIASTSTNSMVNAYDLAYGSLLGSYVATNDTGLSGQPIVTDDCLIVASSSKTYIFNLQNHQAVQTLPFGGSLSLADGNLYLAAYTYVRAYTLALPAPANDVSIAFSALPTNVLALQPFAYTLTVTNPGPGSATGLNVTNFLVPNVTITSAVASQGTCTNYTNGLSAALGNLAAGAAASITVTAVPNTGGNLLATAQLTSTSTDPNTVNNRALAATLALPPISINDVAILKPHVGTTNALFTLSLLAPSSQTISLSFATTDDTATSGIDYLAQSGTITFLPGVTTQSLAIVVKGNTVRGPAERFFLNLSGPVNGAPLTNQARCTILNDTGLAGLIDHFEWSPLASPQFRGEPFAVTLTAKDAFNNVATNFNGAVTLDLKLGGLNFDFENPTLAPWNTLAPASTPYELVQFDVGGLSRSSQAVRFKANSGGPNGTYQNIALNGRVPYTLEADWAMVNESGSQNGADSAQLLLAGSTVASTNLINSRINNGDTFRGHLRGTFTPISSGSYNLTASFTRGYLQVALWSYFDNVSVTFPRSSTNFFPYTLMLTNGVWSGPLTALQPSAGAFLAADDGDGHAGASSVFAVLTNRPPVVNSASLQVTEDTPLPLTLTASDPEGDELFYGIAAQPTNGTLSGAAPSLTYLPKTNYWGADQFAFFANDGHGNSVTGQVAITVVAVTDLGYSRLSLQRTGGQFQLGLLGEPYERYRIEASEDLVHWSTLTNVMPTNGILPFIDPDASLHTRRFYRAALSAAPQLSSARLLSGRQFQLNLASDIGRRCEVSASTNLNDWVPLTNLVITQPAMQIIDPAATNFPCRFYRARILP